MENWILLWLFMKLWTRMRKAYLRDYIRVILGSVECIMNISNSLHILNLWECGGTICLYHPIFTCLFVILIWYKYTSSENMDVKDFA